MKNNKVVRPIINSGGDIDIWDILGDILSK